MKHTIILARGIEGCGVTRYSLEMARYFRSLGHTCVIIAAADVKWSRHEAQDCQQMLWLKFRDPQNQQTIIDHCNTSDFVYIQSLPASKASVGCKAGYMNILKAINSKIVVLQHDHNIKSIRRNDALEETVVRAHKIFTYSHKNDFSDMVRKCGVLKPLCHMQAGTDFDSLKAKYWCDINEQSHITHRWIGRTTSWKGIREFFFFHRDHMKALGAISIMEGIERSLYFKDLKIAHGADCFDWFENDPNTHVYGYKQKIYAFGPYVHHEMMERMAHSAFGYQLTLLKPKCVVKSLEYTHCEIVAAGAVPVFRAAMGDLVHHRRTGDPLTQTKNSGTVWLAEENNKQTAQLLAKLQRDSYMRDEMRHRAFEFYRDHQNAAAVFDDLLKMCCEEA